MSERAFHFFAGLVLLVALYFNSQPAVYGLMAWLAFEVITNQRLTTMVSRLRYARRNLRNQANNKAAHRSRFNFDAERALRLALLLLLTLAYVLFYKQLWIVIWFIGFALVGAGISGICPMIMALKKIGFR